MEGLGEKFQNARQARNLTLEEAARMTKIRPDQAGRDRGGRLFAISRASPTRKGFILIYGKFLNVDVTPYLEAFETSEHMTVDGYSYLQDNPAPPPRRTEVVRKVPSGKPSSLMPLLIGIVVLVVGFYAPQDDDEYSADHAEHERDAQALAQAVPRRPASRPQTPEHDRRAPRLAGRRHAGTNSAASSLRRPRPPTAPPVAAPQPTMVAAATPPASPEAEQEVRRAEPVNPADLAKAQAAAASPAPPPRPT